EGHAARRQALEQTLAAARDALKAISLVLAPTKDAIEPGELTGLYARHEDPQRRIMQAMKAILALTDATIGAEMVEDLHRIEAAAARLVPKEGAALLSAAPGNGAGGAGKARVLVVDDEAGNRDLLGRRLQREGYTVISAAGGQEALATIAREPVDVVLLDVMMPDLDGLAVLERLKKDAVTHDVPVIMISALDDLSAIARCIEAGALDYLPKPF